MESPPGRLYLLNEIAGDVHLLRMEILKGRDEAGEGVRRQVKTWTSHHGKQRGSTCGVC